MTLKRVDDREAGRAAIAELCAQFKENLDYYKSSAFDETSARQRFVDPFFAALGWDVADEQKRGPLADVVLEVSMRGRHQQGQAVAAEEEEDERVAEALAAEKDPGSVGVRRPDYSFRLGGRTRFLVEAKRPSVEINSPRPIYQVKAYGWNADIPVALLTDFEEFLAFDCRYQPVLTEPQTGLIPEFILSHATYIKNWDLLWDTFSHEAVAAGSLARFDRVKIEKGQLPVDVVFLADLARWRQSLARDLAKNNKGLDVWKLNESTQLTLDRLVFIRVCEDRGLEAEEHLRALLEEKDPYPQFIKALAPLRANYNGGLLDPDLTDTLTVTPKVFKDIIRGLYTPWSPYRFDAIGVEILGSIYERALGSIITLSRDRTVKVELKPEVRKAGGVYYTPQWVVDEIVRSTIDPLIARKRPAKGQLLRNSIFGVDVDPAAVEVTTMSLYLKSLEGGSPELLRGQMQLTGAILPSLIDNIRCGNSLVSTDFYQQQQLGQLDAFEETCFFPGRGSGGTFSDTVRSVRSATPVVSVVVPTRDRHGFLADTISSLESQDCPQDRFEIIVVDDGSKKAVTAPAGVKVVRHDTGRGLNAARNSGLREARADLVAFVDDDVAAPTGWLRSLVEGADRHPDAWCFGGPIRLRLEGVVLKSCPACAQLARQWEAELDVGLPESVTKRYMLGANFSLRKRALSLTGPFKESQPIYWDEYEWQDRVHASGGEVVFLPAMWVWHRRTVASMRLDKRLARSYRQGLGYAYYRRSKGRPIDHRFWRSIFHALRRRCFVGVLETSRSAGKLAGAARFSHVGCSNAHGHSYAHQGPTPVGSPLPAEKKT